MSTSRLNCFVIENNQSKSNDEGAFLQNVLLMWMLFSLEHQFHVNYFLLRISNTHF